MGNCVSASTEIAPKIRVVQAVEGRVLDIELPISQPIMKVGELMLEFPPGHFVAQLDKADIHATAGKRAAPLGADADTKPGAVYVLFPMPRLHTHMPPQELLSYAKLLHLHDQQLAKVQVRGLFTASARVTPLADEECTDANLQSGDTNEQECSLQENEQESISYPDDSSFISQIQIQLIKPKPWAPKLQTIMEG